MIDWGKKKQPGQAQGINIGPRQSRGGGMPRLDTSGVTKSISQGINAVGGAARGVTQWREGLGKPTPRPSAPARKSTSKMR